MAAKELIAVVTGANKGIGKAIVEELANKFEGSYLAKATGASSLLVYLTARDEGRGLTALFEIQSLVPSAVKVDFLQLDIDSQKSIETLASQLKEKHGTIDVLINNAGMAFQGSRFDEEVVNTTLYTNYYGTKNTCNAFLPLINPTHGRLINVSSRSSHLGTLSNPTLVGRFRNAKTIPDVDTLMQEFQEAVKSGTHLQQGWYPSGYAVSKMGVTALTRALADQAQQGSGILINACCPGWVRTDMAGPRALKTPTEGAQTPVHLALGDIEGRSGGFWENSKESNW